MRKKNPLVSVIVTTKNSAQTLPRLLASIKRQTYKDIEIIVVDNNSIDETKEIARKFTKNVFNKGPERSAQRNFGVSKSKGIYVLILDSDMVLTRNVVNECVRRCEVGSEKWEVGGVVIPEKSFGRGFWAKVKAFEREFYVGEEDIEAARFFRKTLFEKFAGYDTAITGPEDWDLPLRMRKKGIKIGRIKSFVLHNEGKFSPLRSAQKKFYYASGSLAYLQRHKEMVTIQGNLLLRTVFFRKWRKLLSRPGLALGMFFMRALEMAAALAGIVWSLRLNLWPQKRIVN